MEFVLAGAGLLGGFLLSFVLWWFLAHIMVPKIAFSTDLSRVPDRDQRVRYRLKIRNTGRRDVIDLYIRVRIYIRRPGTRASLNIIEIPTNRDHLFVLRPDDSHIFTLEIQRIESRYLEEEELVLMRGQQAGSLEGILGNHPDSHLLAQILAYDGCSGSRKYYRSGQYRANSIKPGRFNGLIVVSPSDMHPSASADAEEHSLSANEPNPSA